jgi:hypothetical protein
MVPGLAFILHQRLLVHCSPPGTRDSVSGSQHSPAVMFLQSSPLCIGAG